MSSIGRLRHALDLLLSSGDLEKDQHRALLERVKASQHRSEEVLLEEGVFEEPGLLRVLAKLMQCQFVASERLARLEIAPATLALIPRRMAEAEQVFPMSFDAASGTLQVLTPDPNEPAVIDAATLASGARHIKCVLVRPRAVSALIAKHFDRNPNAFAVLEAQWAAARSSSLRQRYLSMGTLPAQGEGARRPPVPAPEESSRRLLAAEPPRESSDMTLSMVEALVGHLERDRGELAFHSALTSAYAKRIATRLGLPAERVYDLTLAALLHDLGKHGPPDAPHHLTSLACQASAKLREQATQSFAAPLRVFEAVELGTEVRASVLQMYERFDGVGGIPGRAAGGEIALGARILSVVDSFTDLIKSSTNPYRRVISAEAACAVLDKAKGSLFDPVVVEALSEELKR